MRKYVSMLAAALLLLGCLTGCGDTATTSGTAGADTTTSTDDKDTVDTSAAYADEDYGFQLEKPAVGEEVAVMHTSKGDIYIRFFPEAAPKAVENFKSLARGGYYNDLTFHRVMKDFMIQGGDPKGDGTGGESIWGSDFADEFCKKLMNLRGSLAMANSGVNTNGSQFFINQVGPSGDSAETLKKNVESANASLRQQAETAYDQYVDYYGDEFKEEYPDAESLARANMTPAAELVPDEVWELYAQYGGNMHLDGGFRYYGGHTVFGQVYEGMDVVDAIASVNTDSNNKPTTAVTIKSVDIITYEG